MLNLLKKYFKKPLFLLIIVSIFIALEIVALILNYWIYDQKVQTVLIKQKQTFSQQITLVHKNLHNMADLFERFKIEETSNVKKFIYQALKDPQKIEKMHYKLYNLLKNDYDYMQSFGLRQLHFHLPGPVSFLRFHRPQKFGDSLVNIREDLMYVNKTKKPLSVFSEGRIFNGFRNDYPLFKGDLFLGTVEISYSFKAMQQRLVQVDPDSAYAFLLKKDVVGKKVFKDEKNNYRSSVLEGWLYDKGPLQEKMILKFSQMESVDAKLKDSILPAMHSGKNDSFLIYVNKHFYIITILPVKNIQKRVVAYILQYKLSPLIDEMYLNMRYTAIFLTLFTFMLTFITAIFVANFMQAKEASVYDLLTGIYNRRQFDIFFEQYISQHHRHNDIMSLIFFDIDHFKRVNDAYGHDVGDDVLKELAKVIKYNIRQSDIFSRWGGEEFMILLPNTSLKEAAILAEKLRQIIAKHKFPLPQQITCSFGVIEIQNDDDMHSALKRVDSLLYQAKESGRNRVCVKN